MSTRYIEIDSTWRNRNLYPNPSNFEIPIAESGAKLADNAISPVCCSAPIVEWKLGNFNTNIQATPANRKYIKIEVTEYLGDSVYQVIQGNGAHILQTIDGYYSCTTVTDSDDPTSQTIYGVIKKYIYLGDGTATLTLNTTLHGVTAGTELYILDPTYLSIDIATGKFKTVDPYIFVPTGFPGTNAYNNFIISNTSKNQYRQTTQYNGITKLLGVDISGSSTSGNSKGPINNWEDTDTLVLRSSNPQSTFIAKPDVREFTSTQVFPGGTLTPPTAFLNELSKRVFQTEQSDALSIPQVGNFLQKSPFYGFLSGLTLVSLDTLSYSYNAATELCFAIPNYFASAEIKTFNGPAGSEFINNQSGKVIRSYYDSSSSTIILQLEFPFANDATMTSPIGSNIDCTVRMSSEFGRITKYVNLDANAGPNSNAGFIEFPFTASNEVNYYNELYITVTTGSISETRIIKRYIAEKNNFGAPVLFGAFLNRDLNNVPNSSTIFYISSGIIDPPFSNFIAKTNSTFIDNEKCYQLLPFSYDGFNPFVYTGSRLSQQEQVCYSIELKNLILPNQVLDGGFGSLIPFYPYIYVQLQNISAPGSGLNNVLYSNNPNSTKMMFRVPITDVPNPVNSTFMKLDSRGVAQTLKFKPNDNLKFGVYLSDGTPFKTLLDDTPSPMKPNPLVQISAIFAIRRLD
jgi:hypothetical protein